MSVIGIKIQNCHFLVEISGNGKAINRLAVAVFGTEEKLHGQLALAETVVIGGEWELRSFRNDILLGEYQVLG